MNTEWTRPMKILIAAMGGEGGGVLSKWLVDVAEAEDFLVQYTYIPGVAQRTGATTYYLEIFPKSALPDDGQMPVRALMACPGDVDVFISTEIVEAGRALQTGLITADRTKVITSTHRTYSVAEKVGMGDGRVAHEEIITALETCAADCHRFNMAACADAAGSIINAVIFGALSASGYLPFPKETFEKAIAAGKASDSNKRCFDIGYAIVSGEAAEEETGKAEPTPARLAAELHARLEQDFPVVTHDILGLGLDKVTGYQDADYGSVYLERLATLHEADKAAGGAERGYELTREGGRWLSRLMAYDDVIRVADLKTRESRFDRVKGEVRADDEQLVRVTDYLKPRAEEIATILPERLAKALTAFSERTGFLKKGMRLKLNTTGIIGFSAMWMLAGMKSRRRQSQRFVQEQLSVETWLARIRAAAKNDYDLALEIAACACLIKGYGPTHCRGTENLDAVLAYAEGPDAAAKVRRLREAALADEHGKALAAEIAAAEVDAPRVAAE